MVYRKLVWYDRNGKCHVPSQLPQRLQRPLMVHGETYKQLMVKGKVSRAEAIREANKRETANMSKREASLYNLELARLTKGLPAHQSYGPFGKKGK